MNGPKPQTADWMERVLKVGADIDIKIPDVQPIISSGLIDIPGRLVAIATHGHASGHVAFCVPAARAVITGDCLVTGHALSTIEGPQPCPWFFNHSIPGAFSALEELRSIDADVIIPGHGQPLKMPIQQAVDLALQAAEESGFANH